LMIWCAVSTRGVTDICEYPDSGKYQVIDPTLQPEKPPFRVIGRHDAAVDYWDGE
jgi:hypothetical protein